MIPYRTKLWVRPESDRPVQVVGGRGGGGPSGGRGVPHRRADLAARVERRAPLLIRRLGRATTVVDLVRAAAAASDPAGVADVLAVRAASWLPALCWAVVGPQAGGAPVVLAGRGVGPREASAVRALGSWVLQRSRVASSADLSRDARVPQGPSAAAVALPLACRARTVAALVGLDSGVASRAPRLPGALRRALRLVLEPAALAMDDARRLARAERLAGSDGLTGLYNVRTLTDTLGAEIERASRTGLPLSILLIDLDGFKQVNDGHGHLRGSRVLVEVAALLRDSMRATDAAARCGGDEFAVVLPGAGPDDAVAAADRLRARIARHVFLRRAGCGIRLTASIGAATTNGAALSAAGLLDLADKALYDVKAAGGNRTGTLRGGLDVERAT